MTYNVPTPTPETAHFWEEAQQGNLALPYCVDTGQYFFYPRSFSPFTGSRNVEWRRASGRATLHSYIINERPLPGREVISPIIALVKLEEGPIMMSNIVDVDPDPRCLHLDMSLHVKFAHVENVAIPVFAPEGEHQ